MTWFGWTFVVLHVLRTIKLTVESKTDEEGALAFLVGALIIAGILFIGTGHI